jgi:transposase
MPTPRVTMSKIRHTLQLLHGGTLSTRQIGAALGISKSTVSDIASYARAAAVDWTLAQTLSDQELQARLYKPPVARQSRHLEPDCAHIHRELRRPGVTLQLLWEEYQQQHGGQAYKYSAFCEKYQAWSRRLKRSMRQTHAAGDKLFVDYAGHTVPIVDASTGEITQAQIFVAVLGASNYTYACATAGQKATDWVGQHHGCAGIHRRRPPPAGARPAARLDGSPRPLRAHRTSPARRTLGALRPARHARASGQAT